MNQCSVEDVCSSSPTSVGSVIDSDHGLSLFGADIENDPANFLRIGLVGEEDFSGQTATIPAQDRAPAWDIVWSATLDTAVEDFEDEEQEDEIPFGHLIRHIVDEDQPDLGTTSDCQVIRRLRPALLDSFDLTGVAKYIKQRPGCKTLVLTGAGISVAAGIPDFRSPGTGLYSRLERYRLPTPSAVFDLDYFPDHPEPFYTVAKELWPGNFAPTLVHHFITLLHEKGLLLRSYTQNIDGLNLIAGLPPEALVEVHGTFATSRCLECRMLHDSADVKQAVFEDQIPCCQCGGLVKPDIVFFGEQLPDRFFDMARHDFPEAELLIVIGTSLQVSPFSSLPDQCSETVPRLLINNEVVGEARPFQPFGFDFSECNYRDAKMIGDCQQGVLELADLLGWKEELLERHQQFQKEEGRGSPSLAQSPQPDWLTQQEACGKLVLT